jgi:hypothetical protein
MSTQTLQGSGPAPAAPSADAALRSASAAAERFPRPAADPQDDWPEDVHLPDEREDDEC